MTPAAAAAPSPSSSSPPVPSAADVPLLDVRNLHVHFFTDDGVSRAVDGVSFRVGRGRTLGLVGESGCGKSVTSLALLRLVPSPPGRIVGGEIRLDGRDLLAMTEKEMRSVRGERLSMIFQEPMTSLNPVFTIGDQVAEVFRVHRRLGRREAMGEATRMLDLVRIPAAAKRLRDYPHQLSGGMRQRVMIAMALACDPDLLIADEPTTALDVTVQAQILDLLEDLKARLGSSVLLITHDLGVIAEVCDDVAVMYAGRIVEQAPVRALFKTPLHPYTQGLMRSIPRRDELRGGTILQPIPGTVPSPTNFPSGCRFHPRCAFADARCAREMPELQGVGETTAVAAAVATAAARPTARDASVALSPALPVAERTEAGLAGDLNPHRVRCHYAAAIRDGTHRPRPSSECPPPPR